MKGTQLPCKLQNEDILVTMLCTNEEDDTSLLLKVYCFSNPKYSEIAYYF